MTLGKISMIGVVNLIEILISFKSNHLKECRHWRTLQCQACVAAVLILLMETLILVERHVKN
jgi:hypothetical protein